MSVLTYSFTTQRLTYRPRGEHGDVPMANDIRCCYHRIYGCLNSDPPRIENCAQCIERAVREMEAALRDDVTWR